MKLRREPQEDSPSVMSPQTLPKAHLEFGEHVFSAARFTG
jgi:hypothetical protein